MREIRNAYTILVREPEEKRQLGRRRYRWEDNIKLNLREIRWEGVDWINLTQDRVQWRAVVNTVLKLGFYKKQGMSSPAE
jgi:hypothetical protein